jgi:2-isopropylmalate synthase
MIEIMDDTLREGMQTPNVMFTEKEKVLVARNLFDAGIRRLIISYPPAHSSEQSVTRTILREEKAQKSAVFGMGRAIVGDVEIIASTGANIALHLPMDGTYDKALEACKYAKDRYPERKVAIGLVDVGSFAIEKLIEIAKEFDSAGVDTIELPDTTGSLLPKKYGDIVRIIKSEVSTSISAHCHNDNGLAVANSLAAAEAGADIIDCTVLGLGERNGIADIAVVSEALARQGFNSGINGEKLRETYQAVDRILHDKMGISFLSPNYPLYGSFLPIHTAGTHAEPGKFKATQFSVNVYCGKALIRKILLSKNIEIPDATLAKVTTKVKDECVTSGKALTYDRVQQIAEETANQES